MKYLKTSRNAFLFVVIFYSFYLIKSGLGINISHNYHLKDVFTRPVEVVKATVHRFWKSPAQNNPAKVSSSDDALEWHTLRSNQNNPAKISSSH